MNDDINSSLSIVSAAVLLSTAAVIISCRKIKNKKRRKTWSRQWLQRRNEGRGILNLLNGELRVEDTGAYTNFLRLSPTQFDMLLTKVEPQIKRISTNMKECISSRNRLEVTLRFLATGESYRSLMYSTRIHESTISKFVPDVCQAIYDNLKATYLTTPNTAEAWNKIAEDFNNLWQFPNCLGALDGRHIKFRAPRSEGSYYYNYKGDHSIVLLGLADANYKFTYVNVGTNGRVSDGGVFRECHLSKSMDDNLLNFPSNKALRDRTLRVPHVIVADDAFPLSHRVLKPYPQRGLSKENRIFNYRLSRARRIIENSFGILANRFRILLNPISLGVKKVETITLACLTLHNFLITENGPLYTDITDEELSNCQNLQSAKWQCVVRSTNEAYAIREEFKNYFNSPTGAVPWQETAILNNNL